MVAPRDEKWVGMSVISRAAMSVILMAASMAEPKVAKMVAKLAISMDYKSVVEMVSLRVEMKASLKAV